MNDSATRSDDEEFQAALQGEDELGVVLRAHIYIEARLNAMLEHMLASPKHLYKMNLEYSLRVSLAVALGLLPQYESPLRALGKIRNDFAHRTGSKLTIERVNALYETLSSEDKQLVHQSHDKTRKNLKTEDKIPSFNNLLPKDKFILIALTLRALLMVAGTEAKNRASGA